MIGGFREWDDVNDPRRSRGSAPQAQNITGLPALGDPARAAVLAARREEIARRRAANEEAKKPKAIEKYPLPAVPFDLRKIDQKPADSTDPGGEYTTIDPSTQKISADDSTAMRGKTPAYSTVNPVVRDINDNVRMGSDRRVDINKPIAGIPHQYRIDPKRVVEVRENPDASYESERFEEINVGKRLEEIQKDYETKFVTQRALSNPETRFLKARSDDGQVSRALLNFKPVIGKDGKEVIQRGLTRELIDKSLKEDDFYGFLPPNDKTGLARSVYEAKQPVRTPAGDIVLDPITGQKQWEPRQIPVTIPDPADPLNKVQETTDRGYRVGSAMNMATDDFRDAVVADPAMAQALEMKMVRELRKPGKGREEALAGLEEVTRGQLLRVREAEGYTIEPVGKSGTFLEVTNLTTNKTTKLMKHPDKQNIWLKADDRTGFDTLFARFQTGPTAFLNNPGTRLVQRKGTGRLEKGDNIYGIRVSKGEKVEELIDREGNTYNPGKIYDLKREIIDSAGARTEAISPRPYKQLADIVLRAHSQGASQEYIAALMPKDATSRELVYNAISDRLRTYPERPGVDLFSEDDIQVPPRNMKKYTKEQELNDIAEILGTLRNPEAALEENRNFRSGYQTRQIDRDARAPRAPGTYIGVGGRETPIPAERPWSNPDNSAVFSNINQPASGDVQAVRDMATADPRVVSDGVVDTNKVSTLNAPPKSKPTVVSAPIPYLSYEGLVQALSEPIGSPNQERAMAILAQRAAARRHA